MIWTVLAVLFLIWLIKYFYEEDYSLFGGLLAWVLSAILTLFLALLMLAICSGICLIAPQTCEKSNEEPIIALNDSIGAKGRIGFLGSGYVQGDLYYYYMTDTERGFRANKIKADNTYVRYSEEPKIETYTATDFNNKLLWVIAFPINKVYVVYIPEGSIIENYRIDLE